MNTVNKPKDNETSAKGAFAAWSPGPEERYQMIKLAAYHIAERSGFSRDSLDCWTDAEAQVDLILALKKNEEALRLAATVFNTIDEGVMVTGPDNRIITVNPSFTEITGYSPADVIGKNPKILASNTHSTEFYKKLWKTLTKSGSWRGEIWNRRKSGELYVEWLSIKLVYDEKGKLTHHVAIFSDISERKIAEDRLQHLANYDALTELPNRMLISDRIQQSIIKAKRDTAHMALMFVDLDNFKPVNDTLGHNVGDLLLKSVAESLQNCVRESDTVARLGGDEFVVLLPTIEQERDVTVVAEKILQALCQPFKIEGHVIRISSSIGVAVYPEHGKTTKQLLNNADNAMYQAKKSGRNNFKIYQRNSQAR